MYPRISHAGEGGLERVKGLTVHRGDDTRKFSMEQIVGTQSFGGNENISSKETYGVT